MGRPQDSTKTKTSSWQTHNDLFLLPSDSDIIDYYTVDDRGYIQTNKRAYAGLNATVIIGKHKFEEGGIDIPKLAQIFSCEIGSRGALSSIGKEHSGEEVTVIIHTWYFFFVILSVNYLYFNDNYCIVIT